MAARSTTSGLFARGHRKAFEFSYDYTRKDYAAIGRTIASRPVSPHRVEGAARQEKKPLDPVFLGAPGEVVYTAKVALPLETTKLPSNVDLSEPWADFHSKYSAEGKTLTVTRRLKVKQSEVALDRWEKYKKWAKAISDDWSETIQLTGAAASGSKEEEGIFNEGYSASNNGDLGRAEDLYKQLIQKNPKYQYAHSNLGNIYIRQGRLKEAISELRKEEELYPDETYSYRELALALERQHDTAGAIEQLQKLLSVDPKDQQGASSLARILSSQKRYSEAIAVLEKATALAPDSQPLHLQLGLLYAKSGDKEKGLPLLQKALDSEPDATKKGLLLNNVAYSLGEMNTALDVAQGYADEAIQQLEAASLKTDSEKAALSNTDVLAATWDTVGWVSFRRGELDKAERYLRAAFALTQYSTEGDHLAQVLEKQGKKQQAEHYYLLAIAAPTRADKSEVREHYKALTGKTAPSNPLPELTRGTEGKPGAATVMVSPAEELSRARSYKIRSGGVLGSATFSVVFSPGKIESATFVSGDEKMKLMADSILASSMRAELPNDDLVHITRRGLLYCGTGGCELTLFTAADAYSAYNKE